MKTIVVHKKIRLDAAIKQHFPDITTGMLYKYTRENKIKVNKKKPTPKDYLNAGDVIEFYTPASYYEKKSEPLFMQAKNILTVVYEDKQVLIVNKPAGLRSIDESEKTPDTLINRALHYLHKKNEWQISNDFTPRLCHRLDTGTCGIIIIAKTNEALTAIKGAIKEHKITKKYISITHGVPYKKSATLISYLKKDAKKAHVYISDTPMRDAKEIKTKYKVLAAKAPLALIETELITGRTHQIRAHLSHISCPILGDSKYGINSVNRAKKLKYQLLCAQSVTFSQKPAEPCAYLYNKTFTVDEPWFVSKFMNGSL